MRKLNKLMALVLSLALCLGMAVTANAAEKNPAVYITKDLKVAKGTTVPAAVFKFNFVYNADASVGMQGIASERVAISAEELNYANVEDAGSDETVRLVTGNVLAGVSFPHAGVYAYTVTEDKGGTTAEEYEGKMTYDGATYTMLVYVENSDAGPVITDVQIKNSEDSKITDNDDNTNGNGSNSDISSSGTEGLNQFKFVNNYIKTAGTDGNSIVITNNVVGDYADLTKPFTYKLTITKASNDTAENFKYSLNGGEEQTAAFGATGLEFTLSNGQSLVVKGLASGATYTVVQTCEKNYACEVASTGEDKITAEANATTLSTGEILVGENGATSTFTNTYDENVVPTGIAMNNAPFMLMIGAAGIFMLLMLLSKKRREEA